MKRLSLTPANLPDSVHRQLNMYALAASAAGVGLLALASPAEAKIIYKPAHRVIGPKHSYNIDLNHDKITDFTIVNFVSACTDYCFFELRQNLAGGNSAVGYTLGNQFLLDSALHPGARIGPRSPFKKRTAALVVARAVNTSGLHSTTVYGPWANVKNRFLGLKFQVKGKTHYGWARLNVTVSKTTITATLTGYAYETVPNKPIVAGKTKGPDEISFEGSNAPLAAPSPEPATLGVLAIGARGLSVWRKESVSAASEN
jgi:hypothetical protein